jgi:uncharacterized Zn-binding protein involved in type VI secretion
MTKPVAVANLDTCGGKQLGGGQSKLFYKGQLVVVVGDPVAPHGKGKHANAKMVTGSSRLFIQGKAVCREGDKADCGCVTTGQAGFTVP